MKKFASALLALTMVAVLPMVQVQASELSLDSAISDLQYNLTVKWDQKDLAAQKKIMSDFTAQVQQLEKQGVTGEEIFTALSAKAFDRQTSAELADLAKQAKSQNLTQEQTLKLVSDYANKSQKLGTSWSPEATTAVVIGVILAGLIVLAIVGGGSSGGYYCVNSCYYDAWGYYYCGCY